MSASPRRVIYVALGGKTVIAVTKFAAGAYSGSSAMLVEGVPDRGTEPRRQRRRRPHLALLDEKIRQAQPRVRQVFIEPVPA